MRPVRPGAARDNLSPRPPVQTALLQIHFCVVLWGFTAILGKLISLPALPLVWWRMLLVAAAIALWPPVWRALRATDGRTLLLFSGAGVVVALHWLTFYGAIKLSNASVAASCMAVAPIFMAVVEPWIARRSFDPRELLIGIVALPGVALVVGGTPDAMRAGILVGILSALLVAIFGSLNKRFVERAAPLLMTWVELAAGTAFLGIVALLVPGPGPAFPLPDGRDFALLVTLAIACTLLPFTLSLHALRHTSAFTAQLAISLEPVYAVLLAIVLLGEQRELSVSFYLGVALIVGSVLVHTLIKLRGSAS
jgi:drug/metabolite transporter (DMT)-like permease